MTKPVLRQQGGGPCTAETSENCRHYLEARLDSVTVRLDSLDKATRLAAEQMEKRLEGMNEFREQLRYQATTFLSRTEFITLHDRVMDDVRSLRESRSELSGKASTSSMFVVLGVSVLALTVAIVDAVLRVTLH